MLVAMGSSLVEGTGEIPGGEPGGDASTGTEQGIPVTINYVWQVVTDEYVVGYLTSSFTAEGVTCTVYRPYELRYARQD